MPHRFLGSNGYFQHLDILLSAHILLIGRLRRDKYLRLSHATNYQKYLINELETYAKHLLDDKEFTQKTPLYNNDLHDKLELIYEEG